MKFRMTSLFKFSLIIALLAILTSIGCGGGTSGSGGRQFDGSLTAGDAARLLSRAGTPISGIKVTIAESGDFDITDTEGKYQIFTEFGGSSVTFLFEGPQFSATYVLENIPAASFGVTVDFEADTAANKVTAVLVEFTDNTPDEPGGGDGSGSATPTATPDNDDDDSDGGSPPDGGNPPNNGTPTPDNTPPAGTPTPTDGDSGDDDKVTICHRNPQRPENSQTLEVAPSAVDSHLAHGDTLGACPAA